MFYNSHSRECGSNYTDPDQASETLRGELFLDYPIKLFAADGSFLELISEQRLQRLQKLNLINKVTIKRSTNKPVIATLWIRPGESVLDRLQMRAYSYQEKWDIYRVWQLMRIDEKDRATFLMSITDNLRMVEGEEAKEIRRAKGWTGVSRFPGRKVA